jgi:hypothetical protein
MTNHGRYVTDQVSPGCEWVIAGDGVPTKKFDGTCCMFDGERWWARREVKDGHKETPTGWVIVGYDQVTGKSVGWEPVESSAFVRWHNEAVAGGADFEPGTYELIGPKINGNPEAWTNHAPRGDGAPRGKLGQEGTERREKRPRRSGRWCRRGAA